MNLSAKFFRANRAGNAFAYEFEGDKKFLLEDKSDNVTKLAEKIVGLGYDDFNKCIALPQGEFARFTKSTGAERLDIVARLFSLEKYGSDLYAKASARANGYESELSNLRSEMSAYAEYGEEQAARLKERIAAGERAEGELSERLKAAETALAEKREVVFIEAGTQRNGRKAQRARAEGKRDRRDEKAARPVRRYRPFQRSADSAFAGGKSACGEPSAVNGIASPACPR